MSSFLNKIVSGYKAFSLEKMWKRQRIKEDRKGKILITPASPFQSFLYTYVVLNIVIGII